MTAEDQKSRDEFEAWERQRGGNLKRHQGGLYANSAVQGHWIAWQASRRTYRATALEEAAQVAKRSIGSGALSALEEYRAKFIEDEIRALASPPPCTGRNCATTTANHSPECVADHLRAVAGKE